MQRFITLPYIILDYATGLHWCTRVLGPVDWHTANNSEWIFSQLKDIYGESEAYNFRLPTIHELFSLADVSRHNPASLFPDMPSKAFWSSSSYAADPSGAWDVFFDDGNVYHHDKSFNSLVRCVRRDRSVDSLASNPSKIYAPNSQIVGRF